MTPSLTLSYMIAPMTYDLTCVSGLSIRTYDAQDIFFSFDRNQDQYIVIRLMNY